MGRELRQTVRRLWRSPGFTAAAVVTLSLGIGATTALFTILNAVVLRPLSYADPDRLVVVWTDDVKRQLHQTVVSHPIYREWQAQSTSLANVGLSSPNTPVTLTGIGNVERLDAARASSSLFAVLGVAPLEGRTFTPEEERRTEPFAVISEGLAERWFGSARAALGNALQLDGRAITVIGVMPKWFHFPSPEVQLWLPFGDNNRGRAIVIARLRDTVTPERARQELDLIGMRLAAKYPDVAADADFPGFRVTVLPLTDQITGQDTRVALWVLLGAVVVVLAIACANVASLLAARVSARHRELALRTALGAGRTQLVTHLLYESLLLTSIAGTFGIVLANWLVRLLVTIAPRSIPRLEEASVNAPVLAFAVGVALLCGLSCGAVPASHLVRRKNLDDALREGGRIGGASAGRRRLQRALVVVEVALTFALVCGAGLLLRSLLHAERVSLGFDPRNVLVFRMVVSDGLSRAQRGAFYGQVVERLRQLPGVSHVGVISNIFTTSTPNATVRIEGRSDRTLISTAIADDAATPELFLAVRTPLRGGRFFSETDTDTSPPVAIVNETFARHFWSGESPIGKRFQFLDGRFGDRWVTVVGVIADMRRNGIEYAPFPQVFVPFAQLPSRGADFAVRMNGDPAALTRSVRTLVAGINPDVPVYRMSTLEQRLDAFLSTRRFQALLLSLFAAAGLLLAAVGLFGLMRYMVALRTREIGVRLAIGATRRQVMGLVLREGLGLAGAGLLVGFVLAFALTRTLGGLLYGVTASDPLTFLLAPAVLLFVAMVASVEPTWRAMRIDPVVALRAE